MIRADFASIFYRRVLNCEKNKEAIKISPVSEAQKRAVKKWESKNCKQIRLVLPNEQADKLEQFCKDRNLTKNGFIRSAIEEKMEREK